ncbi:MAG: hypothetical protein JXA52_09190 [Planctomycetes bacterium]|nr:hypothetical protein [Planctomycetota bacterium]
MTAGHERRDLAELARSDGRYQLGAFHLVWEALRKTTELVKSGELQHPQAPEGERAEDGTDRFHITGQELLEGFRIYALEQYGDLAYSVLNHLGLHSGADVGQIVFLMVEAGYMGKRDSDSPSDFNECYDFKTTFKAPRPAEG